VTKLDKDLVLW